MKVLKDKLAAVKRWEPCFKDSPAGTYASVRATRRVRDVFVEVESYDAILRALDVALRQRDEWIQLHFSGDVSEHFQQEKARMKDDAEILAAFLKDDNDETT